MNAQLDLQELARKRPVQPPRAAKRNLLTRYILPASVILGFAALLGWAARDSFHRSTGVTVVPVAIAQAKVQDRNVPLFQAAGWVEPRPTPIHVSALTEGVIDQLLVVEGQEVSEDEPIATLVDTDARLAVRRAEASLALRKAELESAEAELAAAEQRVEHPLHLVSALADAESALAKLQTELAGFPFALASSTARLEFARQNLDGKRAAGSVIPERVRQQAESELAAAQAELDELKQREPHLRRGLEALERRRAALAQQLDLLIDEKQSLGEAQAKVLAATARRDQAQVELEQSQLDLERTVVRSPIAGRVLQLVARPGTQIRAEDESRLQSRTIVTLYDPQRLQVRVDVRLEDVPKVEPGQAVVIETASSEQPLRGTVLQPTSAANVQKNTLEVKVALDDPPASVRPEMLVTATFLSPRPDGPNAVGRSERLLVPKMLVESSQEGHVVWIVDAQGVARRRTVELGGAQSEILVEVTDGLAATDKLIAGRPSDLREGDRVHIVGENMQLGMERPQP